MIKTLLTRIRNLNQYNSENKTIRWEDPVSSRWENIYGKLTENDNAIFISNDKLLIGIISQVNYGKSLLCINIQEVQCQNDQFLRLHKAYPELISRVKANFQPFIHPLQLDLNQLIADAKNQNLINFFILSSEEKYNELSQSFKENDRIVLLDNNHHFQNVKINSKEGLIDFPKELDIDISIEGLIIDEVLQKNKNYKRKSLKSNNVSRIEKIKGEITNNGIFKFTSFFTYHDTLFNKRVYQKKEEKPKINTIYLNTNESIFKVSMSGKDINDKAFNFFNSNNLIIVHSQTKAKGVSSQTQGDTFSKQMKIGDYFYMCRGNNNVEVIGKITDNAISCEYEDFGDDGWLQRSYEIVSEAIKEESYSDDKKWWTPNDNSTCIVIPSKEIKEANNKLFIPYFDTQFELKNNPLTTTISNSNKIMSDNLNQILYGPPGTGKTYNTILEAAKIITGNESISYQDALEVFNDNLNNRIEFITFHQNYSYEDFIQGIRPDIENGKELSFEKKDGILKKIADRALFEYYIENQKLKTKPNELFVDATEAYLDFFNQLSVGQEFSTKKNKKINIIQLNKNKNIVFKYENGSKPVLVSSNRLLKLYSKIADINQIQNINEDIRAAIGGCDASVYYSMLREFIVFYDENKKRIQDEDDYQDTDYLDITEERKKEILSQITLNELRNISKDSVKKYVIIIDEINRANISRVFGELITLIEEDKRSHGKIPMRVTLPSGDTFIVPSNLHIVGTMNTADKSIALLDIALRRRFDFVPMYPLYEGLKDSIYFPDVLQKMNEKIKKMKGPDFQIGHAYFMKSDNLLEIMNRKVIPLLLEYFMNDETQVKEIINIEGYLVDENSWPMKLNKA
ncbi:AAA family ATPase [Flavobacterium pectinovorum]|uniref:McrB family protein n=1 Tax=Flavobacterium pectinovorum TaxID=29533 RepID=UPI00265EB687|nr:AAA family ATPase [Flavobacterium pectinovorum]WKL48701.1 AAA family ATPase [Flavobacterium pectinovorum]